MFSNELLQTPGCGWTCPEQILRARIQIVSRLISGRIASEILEEEHDYGHSGWVQRMPEGDMERACTRSALISEPSLDLTT